MCMQFRSHLDTSAKMRKVGDNMVELTKKRVKEKTACHLFFGSTDIFLLLFVVYTPHLRGDVCMKG